jgi:chemotaxis protein MotB
MNGDLRGGMRDDDHEDHAGEHAKNEIRWLLPYADMVTLCFALFVLLYAMSIADQGKSKALTESINKAFNGSKNTPGQNTSTTTTKVPKDSPGSKLLQAGVSLKELQDAAKQAGERKAEDERLKRLKFKVDGAARRNGVKQKVHTVIDERGLVIKIVSDDMLFSVGSATVRRQSLSLLRDVTGSLRSEPNPVRVEGHTDNTPISTSQFRSNWELSSARATAVLREMIRDRLAARRLAATGYGAEKPEASNGTSRGRAKNRRVEIVVLRTTGLG